MPFIFKEIKMSSKKLNSILSQAPAATAEGEAKKSKTSLVNFDEKEEIARIVARIPLSLKEDIREYIKNNREETESTLVLKGLKKLGFNIDLKWTIDRRKLR